MRKTNRQNPPPEKAKFQREKLKNVIWNFNFVVFSGGVFSSFRMASFHLFAWNLFVFSPQKDEMSQTSVHNNVKQEMEWSGIKRTCKNNLFRIITLIWDGILQGKNLLPLKKTTNTSVGRPSKILGANYWQQNDNRVRSIQVLDYVDPIFKIKITPRNK